MSWWFKKHPQLLERECNKLGRNSNYKEYFRYRFNLLVSAGEIIVRLKVTTRHPVVIIYPESTPYRLPYVVLLNENLEEDEVLDLSKKDSKSAIFALQKKVRFYNFWHQNKDGSLCLLEADNLEKFGDFFTINDVINRTRDWLAGLKTGNMPLDSPEVEFFAHFIKPDLKKEILIPETFLKTELFQGEFYCTLASHVYPIVKQIEKRIYLGAILEGENKAGVRLSPMEFKNAMHLMPEGINTPLELIKNQALIKQLTENQKMLSGFWWDLDKEISFIHDVSGFAKLIGNGDELAGHERIKKITNEAFKSLPKEVIFAIRFLNKRMEREWQAFSLKKGDLDGYPILGSTNINDFIKVIKNYSLSAIRCTEISENRHHLRNRGVASREQLKDKTINILGCGALGGEVADTISKAGVGYLTLVDPDVIKFDNTIRHVVGVDKMGLLKVDALYQNILYHNPFVKIDPLPMDIMAHNINDFFHKGIGVSTIADDNVEGYLNEQAVINNKTIFYSRALRGGKVGRIFRVQPGIDACFHCLNLYHDEGNEIFPNIPDDPELPSITNECNNPIRPASAAELKLISSITSKLVLEYLQENNQKFNHWIWATENIPGVNECYSGPYELKARLIPPHPDCQYCHSSPIISVSIDSEAMGKMKDKVQENPGIETGGVLLGEIHNNSIHINFVSGAGPNAKKERCNFEKDIEYCQNYIEDKYNVHGGIAAYVGEWHYHPSDSNKPSGIDIKSLTEISDGQGYLTENPVMIILSNKNTASCTIHPIGKKFYYTNLEVI